jgi:hypothetical protein
LKSNFIFVLFIIIIESMPCYPHVAHRYGSKRIVQLQLCRQLPPRRRVPLPSEYAAPPIFQSSSRPFIVEPTMAGNDEEMHHMRGGPRQQQLIVEPTMEEFAMSASVRPKSRSRNAPATSPAQNLENVSDPLGLGILFRRDSRNQLKVTALFPGSDADVTGLIGTGDILYVGDHNHRCSCLIAHFFQVRYQ